MSMNGQFSQRDVAAALCATQRFAQRSG